VRTGGARGSDPIEAYHDRVRRAVLARLDSEGKKRCHHRIALALEAQARHEPGPLLIHWRGAGDEQRAAHYASVAAAQAVSALAFDRASRLYRTAIDLSPDGARLHELWCLYGDALANAGKSAEAAEAYECAVHDAPAHEALELRRRAAEQFLRGGHVDEGLAALETVLASTGMSLAKTPQKALASLLWHRARLRLRGLRFRERDISQVPPGELTKIDVCWSVATALGMVDAIRGADFQTRNLLLSLSAGEPRRVARALAVEAVYASTVGKHGHTRANKLLAASESLAARIDDAHTRGILELSKGIVCSFVGKWRADRDHCTNAERVFREYCTGVTWEVSTSQFFSGWALGYLGEVDELGRHVDQCLRDAEARGDLYAATQLRVGMPNLVWLVRDDSDGARRAIADTMQRWSNRGFLTQHFGALFANTQIDLYRGEGTAAHQWVLASWPALESSQLLRIQLTRVEAIHLRGRAALARAAEDPAQRSKWLALASADADRLAREETSYSRPLGRMILAGIAALRQQPERALTELTLAQEELERAHMKLHATVAASCRGQLMGGVEGRTLAGEADGWMRAQKIREPRRIVAMLAPGL
jgi:tetratricopeptide (TPR) repeat protein